MPKKAARENVTLGLIQMSTGENPSVNLAKAVERVGLGGKKRRADCLSPGTLSLALLLPERKPSEFQIG